MVHLLQLISLHWPIIITQSLEFTLGFTLGVVHSVGLDKWIMTGIHHYIIIQSIFAALKIFSVPSVHPSPWQPLIFFKISTVSPFPECHIVGTIQYVTFSDWLLSLNNMHLKFLRVFHGLTGYLFLALNTIPLARFTTIYLSIHQWHLGYFQDLAIMNKAAINMTVQIFLWT